MLCYDSQSASTFSQSHWHPTILMPRRWITHGGRNNYGLCVTNQSSTTRPLYTMGLCCEHRQDVKSSSISKTDTLHTTDTLQKLGLYRFWLMIENGRPDCCQDDCYTALETSPWHFQYPLPSLEISTARINDAWSKTLLIWTNLIDNVRRTVRIGTPSLAKGWEGLMRIVWLKL